MKVKRLTLRLPAHMKAVAQSEARQIAEALGRELAKGTRPEGSVTVQSHGHRGVVLGAQVASGVKGGRHGG